MTNRGMIVAFGLVALILTLAPQTGAQQRGIRLHARLRGAAVDGVVPVGNVKYREARESRKLVVAIKHVNLPAGTSLQVNGCDGRAVGRITLRVRRDGAHASGRLRLGARDGGRIPACSEGDSITARGSQISLRGHLKQGRR